MRAFAIAALAALPLAAAPAIAQEPSGTWLSQSGDTRVRIGRCGGAYCGTIVAVRGATKDDKNPDPGLRSRNLVGVQMMSGLQPTGDGGWSGSLYNYTDGKTYAGKMRLNGANALDLSGCVLGGLVCRSQTWTRVQ